MGGFTGRTPYEEMKFKKKDNTIYDENGRPLVKIVNYGKKKRLERTAACTIGEYFAILSWMMDKENG